MTGRGLEIKVGAVVILAAVVLVVGTMWFQKFQLAEKRYNFFVRFGDVGGLVTGDPIFVQGVERGRVDKVDLRERGVVVEMAIREDTRITRDARVSLKSIGIMGERLVTIYQGTSPQSVEEGDTLDGEVLMGLSEVMGAAGPVIKDVQETAKSLREVAAALAADGRLQQGVEDFAVTSKNIKDMTNKNRVRLDRALTRFQNAAGMLDSLLSDHYTEMDSSLAAFGRAGGRAEEAIDNLTVVSDDLREITAKLRDGEGSAGRLLNDDTLVLRMERTVASLDSLIADLKKNPGRYVKFSIF